ncbi:zinc-ribbon domain-containing protein [Myxococcaceae bacterium JPH2]|nr:zinc-ribbon domain-containing protein [Myxococcaceae bacterium JPH2]
MEIACPQCSMQYVLDPRLLPPGGTSVQCTECRHVFVAAPPGAQLVGVMPMAGATTPVPGSVERVGDSTLAFGTPASGVRSTQIFGSALQSGATPVPNATQGFGAVPARDARAIAVDRTQSFGAVRSDEGLAPLGKTQGYGVLSPVGGAPNPSGVAPGNKTNVFGALDARSGHGATSPSNATNVFGAVAPTGSSVAPGGASAGNATNVFGAVAPTGAGATSGAAAPGHGTHVFGSLSDLSARSAAPGHGTNVFGAVAQTGGTTPGHGTNVFGALSDLSPRSAAPVPGNTTRIFGNTAGSQGASPSGSIALPPEVQAGLGLPSTPDVRRTAIFGAPAHSADSSVRLPYEPPSPVGSDTLRPFAPLPAVESPSSSGARSGVSRRGSVDLPPELLAAVRVDSVDTSRGSGSRLSWERLLWGLAVVAGLGLSTFLAYPAWRDRNADMPVEAVKEKDRTVALLRRDDAASREQAIQGLRALTTSTPRYAEAQAELAVALALRLDDSKAEAERLRWRAELIARRIAELERTRAVVDWQARVNALTEERTALGRDAETLRVSIVERTQELEALMQSVRAAPEVEPASAVAARVKAQAVHAAVTGAGQALGLSERLRQVESAPSWSVLVRAEYGLNGGSPPESLAVTVAELQALRERDPTLMRAYVLGARLAMKLRDDAAAKALLDEVLALNNKHELARRLLDDVTPTLARPATP